MRSKSLLPEERCPCVTFNHKSKEMRIVLQRVKEASVAVDGKVIASIGKGFLLLVGVSRDDTERIAEPMARKISSLRVFEDSEGKMNLDIRETEGEVLSVPQFTLLGNTEKGNRPGFDNAAEPEKAKAIWESFNSHLESGGIKVSGGEFAAHMEVSLVNDGPVTFVLEKK